MQDYYTQEDQIKTLAKAFYNYSLIRDEYDSAETADLDIDYLNKAALERNSRGAIYRQLLQKTQFSASFMFLFMSLVFKKKIYSLEEFLATQYFQSFENGKEELEKPISATAIDLPYLKI